MPETKFGVINEQGYFGEGYGFTEALEEDREKALHNDDKDNSEKDNR